ncbi:MAG: PEP-CTERM system histidine kinase PrsK [Pseudomonadales bacterium]|nr:PEP-CTERM system histidine kinase PrsK [Pseudomonadales bacterium]MCP5321402.1 PEP-CTERM system histidine kinase PrsK [Pseudomonadales bacterium]MCP5336312.1 PEP-CTERM system histidine kinase PrsK [Pseudomonadales bacterium]
MNVGFFSYLLACAGYLILSALLLVSWRGRALGSFAIGASFCTAIWSGISAASTILEGFNPGLLLLGELLRDAAWFAFLFRTLSVRDESDAPARMPWLMPAGLAVFALCVGVLVAPLLLGAGNQVAAVLLEAGLIIWVIISITGLLLIEQIYRNCAPAERWGLRYLCLGLGAVFAYDFYMYADALLFKQLDFALWSARGVVTAIAAPLVAISIARNPKFDIAIHVSRDVVLHSVTVFGAGSYLLLMATAGYFIRFWGGSWGNVLQIGFLFGSGLLLVVLLFSDRMRRRLRIFLSKHFFSYKYNYREEWLKFTQALAETTVEVPERVVRAIASLVSSPGGMLWEFTPQGQRRVLACWNVPEPDAKDPADTESLAAFLERSGWVVDLDEYARSPGLYEDLVLPAWCRHLAGAWLLVPLLFRARAIGCVLLVRSDLHGAINWEDRDLLKTAGLQAAGQLAQYQADRSLVQAQQFEAFNRLSAYVVHDLKNILAQQSLIVSNAGRHKHKPEFVDDVIDTVRNSVERMTRLMEQMRSGAREAAAQQVNLHATLLVVVERCARREPVPVLVHSDPLLFVQADRERLATVFAHLVQNAQEATDRTGKVALELHRDGDWAVIEIEDSGCGMDAEFVRERLFKPFDSTKGLTGMGIGAYESREFVRALGGEIHVRSQPGAGSIFQLVLPCEAIPSE